MMKQPWFKGIVGAAAIGALVALSACSSASPTEGNGEGPEFPAATGSGSPIELDEAAWDALVDAAHAEGELVVYASQAGSDATLALFAEDYPDIEITVVREVTSDLIARMDQEIAANVAGADVTYHSQPAWAEAKAAEGALATMQLSPDAQESGWTEHVVADYYVPVLTNPYLLAWNSEIGEPVKNIQDLIEKAGDTPVGIAEPISQNGMYQLQTWIDVYGEDILGDLAGLNHTVIKSTTPLAQSLAAGEVGYAVLMTPGLLDKLKAEGAPVEQVVPDGDVTGFSYGPMILAGAEHPAAAQLFVNWMLTQPTQQLLVDRHGPAAVPVVLKGTTGALAWDDVAAVDDREWPQDRRDKFRALWDSYFVG